jgi:GPH family glycoside/pentoside/hexuronide:cation symporter
MLSQGISLLGYVLLWFLMVPGKPWMFMFALPFFSFGIGGLFTLMMSMTADVCDLDELATGKRREGIFGAIYWWMVKLGFAVAGLLSGAIMALVAFTPGAAVQPAGAVDGLRLFYSGVPIFGTLLAMWIMRDYDLDERARDRGARKSSSSASSRPRHRRRSARAAGRAWPRRLRWICRPHRHRQLAGQTPQQIGAHFSAADGGSPARPVLQRLHPGSGHRRCAVGSADPSGASR